MNFKSWNVIPLKDNSIIRIFILADYSLLRN